MAVRIRFISSLLLVFILAGSLASGAQAGDQPAMKNVPFPASPTPAITSLWGGARESIALRADGTVWTWGWNYQAGKLGIGTTSTQADHSNDVHIPTKVHGPGNSGYLTGITAIMGGEHHNFALDGNGTIWAWGWNLMGMVGDGTFTDRYTPVQVKGLSHVVTLGGRGYHSLAVKNDGTVWAWGWNNYGQLGNDAGAIPCAFMGGTTTTCSNVPIQVIGVSGPTAVTGGGFFSLALMPGHTLVGWGENDHGELADGTFTNRSSPAAIKGIDQVIQVSAGWKHAVALRQDGTAWTWGANSYGQLGNGTTADSNVPVQVTGLDHVMAVSGGDNFSAALKSDGTVWTWGKNDFGQLGNGTTADSLVPVKVIGLTNVVMLAARDFHVLVKRSDGTVWAWGSGQNGELGDNNVLDRSLPVKVLFSDAAFLIYLPAVNH